MAIATLWPAIEAALGEAAEAFGQRLIPMLRRLETPADAEAATRDITALFAAHPAANALLMQGLREASPNRPKSGALAAATAPKALERFTRVPVFFGTDRARADGASLSFGAERGPLSLGVAEVSIPDDHRMGEIERPRWWRLEFREDLDKHVVIASLSELSEAKFVERARERLASCAKKEALLFVHGYHVAFVDAVTRAAQLAYDLHFEGIAALYSWPSLATIPGYTIDENNVAWSQPRFGQFLALLREQIGADVVHIIAHSMGNRLLFELLKALPTVAPAPMAALGQVVFAAPDVDADTFKQAAALLKTKARQYTLYASSNDIALKASKTIHRYSRAGDSGLDMVVVAPIDTVDASAVDTSFVGHSYYGDNRSLLGDMFDLVRKGARPNERFGLVEKKRYGDAYWSFKG
ncbi:MAG: alpha/beta hydrolase [Vicinamibacteraceae bacterium]